MNWSGEIKGRHVLGAMLAFFAVTLAVNAAFFALALRTFPGEEVEKTYLQGVDYNRVLEARAAQAELGWRVSVDRAQIEGASLLLELSYWDASGRPIGDLAATGALKRPAGGGPEFALNFAPAGVGRWRAVVEGAQPGQWLLRTSARSPAGAAFDAEARIYVE